MTFTFIFQALPSCDRESVAHASRRRSACCAREVSC
jgi:hypothetical protein